MSTLSEKLDRLTRSGELYEKLEGGAVRCYACAHRCLIKPGRRGICQVRFNQDGELRVPWGYVAALQVDPIEKKPFSHLYPGADALTFGMLGCDFHCGYCFPGETMVITNQGPITLREAFESTSNRKHMPDGEIAFPEGLKAVNSDGKLRTVRAVFRHPYRGKLVKIQPYYLPELHCTPEHKIYATLDATEEPGQIAADQLTDKHLLVVPRKHTFSSGKAINVEEILGCHRIAYKVRWDLSEEERAFVRLATEKGQTSREIGLAIGKDASYIRHVRSKLAHGKGTNERTNGPIIEENRLRFPNEHRPGLPLSVPLDEKMARLLGYYCAEGSVVQSKRRPNSLVLNFSFSPEERDRAEEVANLLKTCLGIESRIVGGTTTLRVAASKASAALLFVALAGKGAAEKQVPQGIFDAPEEVAQAFLRAYVAGDGHVFENGKVSITTVSRKLAHGVAWLALKLGFLPSIYDYDTAHYGEGIIQGRKVKRAPIQYSVVWYETSQVQRKIIEREDYYLIPVRSISQVDFEGSVFNMEVDEIHNYLAGMLLVSNCQNWNISQVGRDEEANSSISAIQETDPEILVRYAKRSGAEVIVSSYNEPLITSEWAVSVFQKAKEAGLSCAYVSNGNATPEVLAYLRPYLSGYKVDLKTMQDRQYRKLGGVLNHVLDTIRMARELGLWVEVVTLVVPGFNDSTEELWDAARFLASVSTDIPWHVTAFHPDYKMDSDYTPATTLIKAAEIGQEAGLHFVYAGNLPGRVGTYEDTFCQNCGKRLIQRSGYVVLDYRITAEGKCPDCGTAIPGVWTDHPENVRIGGMGYPRRVRMDRQGRKFAAR